MSMADMGRRKGLSEQGVTAPADIRPSSFSLTMRPGAKPGSQALPAIQGLQGEHRGGRREGPALQGARELSRDTEPFPGLDTIHLRAAGLLQSHTLWRCQCQVKFGSMALGSVQRPAWVRAFLDRFIGL